MSPLESGVLVAFLLAYLGAFGLFQFLIFTVNRKLPSERQIPHSLYWGSWNRLRKEYKSHYPDSGLYELTQALAVFLMLTAIAFLVLRVWSYLSS